MLEKEFDHLVDYSIPNDTEEEFLQECRNLDEIADFCGIDMATNSFEDLGREVLADKKQGEGDGEEEA